MKYINWIGNNILFVLTLFLLAFIPLYPKKPLVDIANTWVYIRAEDFVVILTLLVWAILLFRNKITLKTPLTTSILLFWIAGAIATIHGVVIIFPSIADVFPNVAFLSYLRRIEYLSLFFVSYAAMKEKRFLPAVIAVLFGTLLAVIAYGFGQKYLGFPAYLTMNEEFAKGVGIQLSSLSRVSSTFGGHYDLAAYLVMTIPIMVSIIFGVRDWYVKILLLVSALAGFVLLFMTVSRVSFFALVVALFIVLFFQKKKLVLLSIPVMVVAAFIFISFTPALLDRFGSTVKEIDVLIDVKTGEVIGHTKEVPSSYFENKIVRQKLTPFNEPVATTSALASPSAAIHYSLLPATVLLIEADNKSTGENLPQGTGYINLSLSPVTKKVNNFFYEGGAQTPEVLIIPGEYLIKRALAYDLSFTTRFQGEWPRAMAAFKRNILFGSGYGSISLAIDNNYLRILGETGLVGFSSYFVLFVVISIYIRKILPEVTSPLSRSFIVGFAAGGVGLLLNAFLIDVFEASKIAFYLWLLAGVTMALLHSYRKSDIHIVPELKKIIASSYTVVVGLFVVAAVLFLPMLNNYFVGDDFTWLRWAANSTASDIGIYFTDSDGFFYRPGTKIYFQVMYNIFWLNQAVYHAVSIFLHFIVSVLVFFLSRRIFRSASLAALTSFLFLILSSHSEAVFWISTIGTLFTATFSLASLLFFIFWDEKRKRIYLMISVLFLVFGFFFHELGIVTPLLFILYKTVKDPSEERRPLQKIHYVLFALPVIIYLFMRFIAGSHWLSGDYNYNLLKLPFNIVGNVIGYISLVLVGPMAMPFYQTLRTISREHIVIAGAISVIVGTLFIVLYKKVLSKMKKEDKQVVYFGLFFALITLLPFLGLGNITSRYSYLASVGFLIVLVHSLKKIYVHLQNSGRNTARMSLTVVIAVFALLHIIQIQQIHGDWRTAGQKVKNFFIAIDASYQDYWSKEHMEFHFVNVPIRQGEAWVFPVGLSDALWLTFRNSDISVFQSNSKDAALNAIDMPENEKVFVFDDSGRVTEVKKTSPVTVP